jgi:Lrp/AsnC family transcriptional regulator for asnA, asnC and gidA
VGFNAYAQVFISVRPAALIESVATQLIEKEEVSFLALTTGSYDFEINLMCRNNNHLTKIIADIQQIEGIFETKTNMYFKILKLTQPDLSLVRNQSSDQDTFDSPWKTSK